MFKHCACYSKLKTSHRLWEAPSVLMRGIDCKLVAHAWRWRGRVPVVIVAVCLEVPSVITMQDVSSRLEENPCSQVWKAVCVICFTQLWKHHPKHCAVGFKECQQSHTNVESRLVPGSPTRQSFSNIIVAPIRSRGSR